MGFFSMLLVASMPIVQVLLIGVIGAFLASGYSKVLTSSARRDMNKVVFTVFTPSLIFASLAKTVTLADVVSWWFMPVNIAITFLVGSALGWIACRILKPPQHFRGLIIAFCSAGNLGNLLLIVVPAVCDEDGNPFGKDRSQCRSRGLSYSSLSMALGGLFIWTYTYSLMQKSGKLYHKMQSKSIQCPADSDEEHLEQFKEHDESARDDDEEAALPMSAGPDQHDEGNRIEAPLLSCESDVADKGFWTNLKEAVHQFAEELMAPPTISAIIGFVVGLVPWLKSLLIGDGAPLSSLSKKWIDQKWMMHIVHAIQNNRAAARLGAIGIGIQQAKSQMEVGEIKRGLTGDLDDMRGSPNFRVDWIPAGFNSIGTEQSLRVIQDSLELMGNGTIPCITLILGGNLTQGLRKSMLKRSVIVAIVCIRYVALPVIGIAVVHAAHGVGFLPHDPLYRYVLMMQFALPPAMNIGTMAQLFDVGQEECSVIFLWTYLVAAVALTTWSTVFMSILS